MLVDTGRSADNTPHVTHSLIPFVVRGRAHLMQLVHLHHLLLMKRTLILFLLRGLLDQLQLSNNVTCTAALLLQLYLLHQLLLLLEYLMPLNLNPVEVLELGQA
jgi:hypothetical protein